MYIQEIWTTLESTTASFFCQSRVIIPSYITNKCLWLYNTCHYISISRLAVGRSPGLLIFTWPLVPRRRLILTSSTVWSPTLFFPIPNTHLKRRLQYHDKSTSKEMNCCNNTTDRPTQPELLLLLSMAVDSLRAVVDGECTDICFTSHRCLCCVCPGVDCLSSLHMAIVLGQVSTARQLHIHSILLALFHPCSAHRSV